MRALFVQPGSLGGAERQTVMMARLLASHGVDVHLLVRPDIRAAPWLAGWDPRRVTFSNDLLSDNRRDASTADRARLRLWRHLPRGFRVARTIERLLREKRIDVVYASQPFAWGCATPAARRFGARVIWRIGGPILAGGRYGGAMVRLWAARHPPDAVVTCSQEIKAVFAPLLPTPISVIPNGVDTEHFRRGIAPTTLRPPGAVVTVGCAGRMVESKGVNDLLTATVELARTAPEVRVLFAGDGSHLPLFRRRAKKLGLGEVVRFLGVVADMRDFYEACDVFVLPSYAEGHANVLLEAMAMGVPVVTTKLSGTREIIDDGVHGVLVSPGDVGALTAAVTRLCRDPSERQRLAAAALRRVETRLDARRAARKLSRMLGATSRVLEPGVAPPDLLLSGEQVMSEGVGR